MTDLLPETLWTFKDVAAYLGVKPVTVRTQVQRGRWPQPDGRVGHVPYWLPETITTWRPKAG